MLSTQFCPTCGAANEAAQTRCFACGQTLSTGMDVPAASNTPFLHERYQLGAMLGSGGFSTVYRAHDVQARRDVTIKQTSLHGLSAQEVIEATDTFNREASVLSTLHHPQIPQIYDQFSDQGITGTSCCNTWKGLPWKPIWRHVPLRASRCNLRRCWR
jgi:hypothetical protein